MSMPLWFSNLASWSLQVALLVLAAGFLPRLLQIRQPHVLLIYWRVLLAINLLLPFVQPWHRAQIIGTTTIAPDIDSALPASSSALPNWHFLSGQIIPQIVGIVIFAGIAARFVLLALGLLKLQQFRQASTPLLSHSESAAVLEEMRARVNTCAEFRLSADVDSPVTFGFGAPVILLPERFQFMETRFQAAIACHELLHICRRDWAHHLAEEIPRAVFWFHPAIAWLIGRVRLAREQVVDLEVVRLTKARKTYLEALLGFTTSRVRIATIPAPPFLAERQLVERVALMLKEIRMSRTRLIASLTVITCELMLVATLAAWTFPLKAALRTEQNPQQGGVSEGVPGGVTARAVGPKIVVADLRIDGDVRDVDAARARILKRLDGREFDSGSKWLEEITEVVIRAEFQDRGYFKVLLKNPQAQPLDAEKHRMLVTVHVDEGEQYRTGDISIVSDDPAHPLRIPEQDLRQQIQLQTGDLFNADGVREGVVGIGRLYQARGYRNVTVMPKLSVDDKNHTVATTVQVHVGTQSRSENLDKQGPDSAAQTPTPSGTHGVGYPSCIYCPAPDYPEVGDTTKLQIVSLRGVITAGGLATNVEVVKSAGLDFDKSAIETVKKWRFQPATDSNGKSVPVLQEIDVAFRPPTPRTQK